MIELFLLLMAAGALAAAAYAQWRLGRHTRSRSQVWAVRMLLAATGVGLGAVGAWPYYGEVGAVVFLLVFLIGFGVAHVPAAFILAIKRRRGEYD